MDANGTQRLFFNQMPSAVADRLLVTAASDAMRKKLTKKRTEDMRKGWHRQCSNSQLLKDLKTHVDKGDMVDVMNYAAMLYVRSELYGDDA